VKVGQGVTGRAAQTRQAVLVADATQEDFTLRPCQRSLRTGHSADRQEPSDWRDRSEARERGYFTEEHKRLLTLIASRMAVGIETRGCTRAPRARPARCFAE